MKKQKFPSIDFTPFIASTSVLTFEKICWQDEFIALAKHYRPASHKETFFKARLSVQQRVKEFEKRAWKKYARDKKRAEKRANVQRSATKS